MKWNNPFWVFEIKLIAIFVVMMIILIGFVLLRPIWGGIKLDGNTMCGMLLTLDVISIITLGILGRTNDVLTAGLATLGVVIFTLGFVTILVWQILGMVFSVAGSR